LESPANPVQFTDNAKRRNSGALQDAKIYDQKALSLPLFPSLTKSDVDRVIDRFCDIVAKVYMPQTLTDPVEHRDKATSRWLFRVSSSPGVGGGHIARCTALGLELLQYHPVTMMLDLDGLEWRPGLEEKGFDVCTAIDPPKGPWSGSLVDGYHFDRDCFSAIRKIAAPLAFILDQGPCPPDADLIISPSQSIQESNIEHQRLLSGFEYALLGPSYRDRPGSRIVLEVGKIFVVCGMRDTANATGLILAALRHLAQTGFRPTIDVAIGSSAPHLPTIKQTLAQYDAKVTIHENAKDVAGLMSAADMVIGTGGMGLLERMACGVPSITLSLAENQVSGAQMAHELGATQYVGSVDDLTVVTLAMQIRDLARDVSRRRQQTTVSRNAVDGRGAARVANAMMELAETFQHPMSMSRIIGRA